MRSVWQLKIDFETPRNPFAPIDGLSPEVFTGIFDYYDDRMIATSSENDLLSRRPRYFEPS